jgi:ABC-type sugar transport system ATPase subunit
MIELDDISIQSGPFSLTHVSLNVPAGAYAVLMGETGQGKTTILEAICGLRRVTSGRVLLGNVDMTHRKPADRGVGYLPQDLALFPMMTVRGHLEFALQVRRWSTAAIRDRVDELAHLLSIEPLLARHVQRLSGGEAQRVALGRALSFQPQVLLLDEPLNSVDELTRDRLCELLRTIQKQTGLTTLHVTHSRTEARQLADLFVCLKNRTVEMRPLAELDQLADEHHADAKSRTDLQSISSGRPNG